MRRMNESGQTAGRWRRRARTLIAAALLVSVLHVAGAVARADVPTAQDMTDCNVHARHAVAGSVSSPTRKDEVGAAEERKTQAVAAPGGMTRSPDPQLDGMDAGGARDAGYRAAYRVCMRKKGF